MNLPRKPTLCLDFDGVVNSYASGWRGADVLPDPPVPGAIEAILRYADRFCLCIHSSRFNASNHPRPSTPAGPRTPMDAVKEWLVANGVPAFQILTDADHVLNNDPPDGTILLVSTKPPAFVTIDDRAVTFDGTFPDADTILAFRPWNKKGV